MKSIIYVIMSIVASCGIASAGGSIAWSDAKTKIAKTDTELVKILERDFDVDASGGGVRLGPRFEDRQGERISPFSFGAMNRKTKERCDLVIEESDDFGSTGRFKFVVEHKDNSNQTEQTSTEQPTTRPESKLENSNKTQPKAEERNDFFLSFSKSPDERFSIGLDGTLGPEDKATPEFNVHMARLYDRKAGKFVGRKVPLSTPGCHIDFTNKKIGHENWEAFWHPMSKFVVLAIPVTVSEKRGPHSEFFYFQVTDTGILPMSPPDVTSHVFRSFKYDEEISIGAIYPEDWIEENRLRVNIFGSHFDGEEAPDFRLNGVLKFHEDGNITVDSIVRYQPEPDLQTE